MASYSQDARHIAAEPAKITAIRVNGEVLTKTQESLLGSRGLSILANDAVGDKRDLEPSHDEKQFKRLKAEKKIDDKEEYDTYLHGIDEVIDSTETQKLKYETNLKGCLYKKEK